MARKKIWEARLETGHFKRGVRTIETGSQRIVSAMGRARLAFRHFTRGNVRRGFTHLGQSIYGVKNRIVSMANGFRRFGSVAFSALSRVFNMMRRLALIGGIVGGVVAGVATKAVLSSASFESEVSRAAILAGASPGQREKMRAKARATGIETPFTLGDIATTEKRFAKFGFGADDILKLVDATKLLAVVAETDMATAGDTLVQVLGQFSMGADKAQEVALKLAGAVINTALSGDELFDAMKDAGSAAGVFGADLGEVLAVVGELRKQLGRAEKASVAVRNLFLVLSAVQGKSPKLLESIGLDPVEAKDLFNFMGEAGKGKSLVEAVGSLGGFLAGREELAAKLGIQKRTILAFETIRQKGTATFADLKAKIEDTANTQEKYNLLIDLMDMKLKRMRAALNAVFVALGGKTTTELGLGAQIDEVVKSLGQVEAFISNLSSSEIDELVSQIPAALLDGVSTAVQFFVEAFVGVAPFLGFILGGAIVDGAVSGLKGLASGAGRSTVANILTAGMSGSASTLFGGAPSKDALMRNALQNAQQGVSRALQHAIENASKNPLVRAAQDVQGAQASRGFRKDAADLNESVGSMGKSVLAKLDALIERMGSGEGNHGVVNNYGAGSPAARAQPSRPAGRTSQEAAGK